MTSTPRVSAVMPGGQSGHPLSPHYADQYRDWLDGALHPIAAAPEELGAPHLELLPVAAH